MLATKAIQHSFCEIASPLPVSPDFPVLGLQRRFWEASVPNGIPRVHSQAAEAILPGSTFTSVSFILCVRLAAGQPLQRSRSAAQRKR